MATSTRFLDPVRHSGKEPPVPNLRRDLAKRAAIVSLFLLSFVFLEYHAWISERLAAFSDGGGDWAYLSYHDPLLGITEAEAALEIFPGFTLGDLARLLRNPATYGIDRSFFRAFMAVPELRNSLKGFRTTHSVQALLRNLRVPALRELLQRFSGERSFERRLGALHSARSQQLLRSGKSAPFDAPHEPTETQPADAAQASFAFDPTRDPSRILDAAASGPGGGTYAHGADAFATTPFVPGSISREAFLSGAAREPAVIRQKDFLEIHERTPNTVGPINFKIEVPESNAHEPPPPPTAGLASIVVAPAPPPPPMPSPQPQPTSVMSTPPPRAGTNINVEDVLKLAAESAADPCHGLCDTQNGFRCTQLTAPPVPSWSCIKQ